MAVGAAGILMQMFYEPGRAFAIIEDGKKRAWLPVAAATLLTAAMLYWYFSTVDFNWLIDSMVAANSDMKPEHAAAMREQMSPGAMTWASVGSSLVVIPFTFAVYGVYYLVASKFLASEKKFGEWFAFSAWIGVPALLALPLMALQIVTGNGQVSFEDLNMTNLNYLLFHLPVSSPWFGLASAVSLTTFWSFALSVTGLRVWTRCSLAACIVASLLPLLLFYGLWAAKIVAFG